MIIDGMDIHLNRAINLLIKNYEKAKQNPIVENPTNYALYHTWKYLEQLKEQKMIAHVDFGVSENCINHYSYGEICVHCGCCEDIEPNKEKRLNNQLEYYNECVEENNNFSNWDSNEVWRKVQEENIKENNIYYAKKIEEIKKQLEQLKSQDT